MKKELTNGKKDISEKERQRILNSFYTQQIKNGKTTRADIFDKISMILIVSILLVLILYRMIGNFIISFILAFGSIFYITYISRNRLQKQINKNIEIIKENFKVKLEEERILSPDEDIEDYIIKRHLEKKNEFKENINPYAKGKVIRLYTLSIIFFIASHFTVYKSYYKIISVIIFIIASFIGSYKLIEYIRKRDKQSLLNKD